MYSTKCLSTLIEIPRLYPINHLVLCRLGYQGIPNVSVSSLLRTSAALGCVAISTMISVKFVNCSLILSMILSSYRPCISLCISLGSFCSQLLLHLLCCIWWRLHHWVFLVGFLRLRPCWISLQYCCQLRLIVGHCSRIPVVLISSSRSPLVQL